MRREGAPVIAGVCMCVCVCVCVNVEKLVLSRTLVSLGITNHH